MLGFKQTTPQSQDFEQQYTHKHFSFSHLLGTAFVLGHTNASLFKQVKINWPFLHH